MVNRHWRINENIRAAKLRVIGADGKTLGILDRADALVKAKEEGIDLIEIAPQANPPVARLSELGKFLYQEEKRARAQKLKSKASELKEIRFSPFIAENDFTTRINRVKEFLNEKNKVKIVVKFTGRQMDVRNAGYDIIDKILEILKGTVVIDMKPKFLGRHLVMVISPLGKSKQNQNNHAETQNQKIDS